MRGREPLAGFPPRSLMLKVENLTKVYDDGTVALRDVSFEVPEGQFLAIIGLSGSGKSTLLRCINRLIDPTEGRILWKGEDITAANHEDLRNIRRRIGMVFQEGQGAGNSVAATGRTRREGGQSLRGSQWRAATARWDSPGVDAGPRDDPGR